MLAPQPDHVPMTFEELYGYKDYRIIFDLGGVSGWNWFITNNNSKIKSLVKRANKTEDTSWCTTKAFQEIQTVCAGWDFSIHFAASKNLTVTFEKPAYYTSKPLFEAWFVFSVENNSVLTNEFQFIGQTFYEMGLLEYWEQEILREQKYRGRQWLEAKKNTKLYKQLNDFRFKSRSRLEKLEFRNVQFIFILYSVGMSMACTAFCVEHYCPARWNRVTTADQRIRKISRIVQRKISMSRIPSESGDGGDVGPPNMITVTFLP